MTIVIVFKSGYELKVKCEESTLSRDIDGVITNIKFKGVTENKPLDINFDEVACIYRVMSDEEET